MAKDPVNEVEETEANVFAMELLMPLHLLKVELPHALKDGGGDIERVVNLLAKKFEVEPSIMFYRLVDQQLIRF